MRKHGGPSRPRPSPKQSRRIYVTPDDKFFALRLHRWQERRARRKARVAAMPVGRRVLRRSLIAGTWLLGLIAALMVAAIVLFYTLTDVPRPENLALPQKATIEYADGSTLATIGSVDRTVVHLDQVPRQTQWAVLAAEDRGFYSESAVSIRGTARAAITDITGGNTQGGSGITQQYVKNAYLNNSQTLSRKLKELMIAVKLSREYSKDQILEFYLNTVYFGRNTYGIQAAAQSYFGENVEQLTTAQGALLAGMLRAPGYYDPAVHPRAAQLRWRYVLDGMVSTGHLAPAAELALTFPKTKPLRGNSLGATGWKYLLKNAVLTELAEHGISAEEVAARGLTIRTTIRRQAQDAALSAISSTFTDLTKKQRNLKNALVAVNPGSGAVLAYYGGTGPDVKGLDGKIDYNDYAGQGGRPPGSSFKPFTLATALTQTLKQTEGKVHYALDSNFDVTDCTKVEGTKICNDPGDKDLSGSNVTLAEALKYSLNTTFDELASEVGPDQVAGTAHTLGVAKTDSNGNKTLVNEDGSTSFGIGIGDYPVSVVDQASAFATLADKGVRNNAYLVETATGSDGAVVYQHKADPQQVIDKRVANDVTVAMKPIAGYSGDGLSDGRDSAAKTGTEGLSGRSVNNSDAWMVGFTPQVSAAVWVGTGYSRPIYSRNGNPLYGSGLPGQTWQKFMDGYLKNKQQKSLPDDQQIDTDGTTPAPQPSYTPPPYTPPPPTDTVPDTSTPSTTTPPSTSTPPPPPPSTSSSRPAPAPTRTTACGGLLEPPCDQGG